MNGNFYTRMILHIMSCKFTPTLTLSPSFASVNSKILNPVNLQAVHAQENIQNQTKTKKKKITGKADKFWAKLFLMTMTITMKHLSTTSSSAHHFHFMNQKIVHSYQKNGWYGRVIIGKLVWCTNGIIISLSLN